MANYLVDTNVMLAASAYHNDQSGVASRAMPREDTLRELVHDWMANFASSDDKIVLDEEFVIWDEYQRNLPYNQRTYGQEYGLMVLQQKQDRGLVEYVPIEVLEGNGERIGVISDELAQIVTDREDRKWIAVAVAHFSLFEQVSPIVYGAESDWFQIQGQLEPHGIEFVRLLPDGWYTS